LKTTVDRNDKYTYDVIIVPGVPYYPDSVSMILQARIQWSVYLYKAGITRNIIYSGADVYTPYVEGKIMSMIAQQNGIPESAIYVDTLAEHGVENLYYGYKLAYQSGFKKIALATDPFQESLLELFIGTLERKFKIKGGLELLTLEPDDMKDTYLNLSNIPDSLAYASHHVSILNRKSSKERFRGSLGYNINWND